MDEYNDFVYTYGHYAEPLLIVVFISLLIGAFALWMQTED